MQSRCNQIGSSKFVGKKFFSNLFSAAAMSVRLFRIMVKLAPRKIILEATVHVNNALIECILIAFACNQ
jgi:hypothetical protein